MVLYYSAALWRVVISTTLTISQIQQRTYTVIADKDNPTEVDRKHDFSSMSVVSVICQLGVSTPSTALFLLIFILLYSSLNVTIYDRGIQPGPVSGIMSRMRLVVSLKGNILPATELTQTIHQSLNG